MEDKSTDPDLQLDLNYLIRKESVVRYLHWLCRLLDDFDIERFVEEFTDDGTYRLIPRDNYDRNLPVCIIDDNKDRLRYRAKLITEHWHYEKFRETRVLSNTLISFPEKTLASSQSNFTVYRTDAEGRTSLHMVGRLEDRLVWLDGHWRMKDRLAILESYLPQEAIVVPP